MRGRQRRCQHQRGRIWLCVRMTGPSSTTGRGHGRFSRPNGGDAKEDRGSDGNNGTPDNRGSGEERDDGSALPATAVNLLDSAKHMYRRRLEGGGLWNNATATDDDSNNSGVVKERCQMGGGLLTRPGGRRLEHSAASRCLLTSSHREWIARAMNENGVVILAGSTGSGKSTQVLQFLLEEKEEEEDDPIDGGGGGSGDPCRQPDGIWEQRRRQRLRRQ